QRRFHSRKEAVVTPREERAVEQLLWIDRDYRIDGKQHGPSQRRCARKLEQLFGKEQEHEREEPESADRKALQDIFQLPPFHTPLVAGPEMFDVEIAPARKPDSRHRGDRAEKEHPKPGAKGQTRN